MRALWGWGMVCFGKTDVIIAEQWVNNREDKKHRNLEVPERTSKVTLLDCHPLTLDEAL